MGIMLYRSLLSCYSRGAFLLGEVDDLESPQSPFSFAKMFNVLKWFGENETLRRMKIELFLLECLFSESPQSPFSFLSKLMMKG